MRYQSSLTKRILVGVFGLGVLALLGACQKTEKTTTAGGGSSTQSVMTFRGATR